MRVDSYEKSNVCLSGSNDRFDVLHLLILLFCRVQKWVDDKIMSACKCVYFVCIVSFVLCIVYLVLGLDTFSDKNTI